MWSCIPHVCALLLAAVAPWLSCAARADSAAATLPRTCYQVEQYSQKLRARAARADATAETLDASRLLAHEGLNPRKLTQALQTFELRPTFEDVFAVETATVEEYLQQVRGPGGGPASAGGSGLLRLHAPEDPCGAAAALPGTAVPSPMLSSLPRPGRSTK